MRGSASRKSLIPQGCTHSHHIPSQVHALGCWDADLEGRKTGAETDQYVYPHTHADSRINNRGLFSLSKPLVTVDAKQLLLVMRFSSTEPSALHVSRMSSSQQSSCHLHVISEVHCPARGRMHKAETGLKLARLRQCIPMEPLFYCLRGRLCLLHIRELCPHLSIHSPFFSEPLLFFTWTSAVANSLPTLPLTRYAPSAM